MSRLLLVLLVLWTTVSSALGIKIGIVTDVHYADRPNNGKRAYSQSLKKLEIAVAAFNKAKVDFAIQLGDFIDEGSTIEAEAGHARAINAVFAKFNGPRHHVLGNHDVWALTKAEFLNACGVTNEFYSFDHGGFHFVVLDACTRADGQPYGGNKTKWTDTEIPPAQRDWLAADLQKTDKKTICFSHQRIDVANKFAVKSGETVRKILEDSGKVLAVFHGHAHDNRFSQINGVRYWTLSAMVDTPGAYSILEISDDNSIRLTGFLGHKSFTPAE